jgi:uncharacterized protein (DUF1800 family)
MLAALPCWYTPKERTYAVTSGATPMTKAQPHVSRRMALAIPGAAALSAAIPLQAQSAPPVAAPAPAQIAPAAIPTPPLAVIALNRLAYGPHPGDLDYDTFASMAGATDAEKLVSFVDWQLNPAAITDTTCDSRLASANLPTLGKTVPQLWAEYYLAQGASRQKPISDIEVATFIRAIYSRRQLFEVLVEFWHNHFSIFGWDGNYASVTWPAFDRDVIRGHALGNFRTMLGLVATSPAMLYYLDNFINQVAGFNENWARELCELHTLGAENYLGVRDPMTVPKDANGVAIGYVDNDVYEIARCFTGWTIHNDHWEFPNNIPNDGTFYYFDSWHDKANKFVLGKYFPNTQANNPQKDGLDVLDMLASHPGTGRFICRKLCRRLISDTPPDTLVESAAQLFTSLVNDPEQIKKVVRFIVLSPEFAATWGEKIKRPFEATVAAMRAINANFSADNSFFWRYDNIGQPLFGRRPPDGFPDLRTAWASTSGLLRRWQIYLDLLEDSIDGTTVNVVGQTPGSVNTANALADFWIMRILGQPMSNEQRGRIVDFMRAARSASFVLPSSEIAERLPRMVALILMSPEFQYR